MEDQDDWDLFGSASSGDENEEGGTATTEEGQNRVEGRVMELKEG